MDHRTVTRQLGEVRNHLSRFWMMTKDFFRTPFYVGLLLAGLLGIGIFLPDAFSAAARVQGGYSAGEDVCTLISALYARSVFLALAVFLLLGFSATGRCKRFSLAEAISPGCGLRKTLGTQVFLLFCLALLWQLVVTVLALLLASACGAAHQLFLKTVWTAGVLYGLLPALMGTLLGTAWQSLGSKTGFFLFFLWTVFFSSNLSTDTYLLAGSLLEKAVSLQAGASLQRFLNYWYRLPPLCNDMVNTSVGISAEPLRWVLYLAWSALGGSVLLWCSRRRVPAVICLCLCLLCSGCFLRGGSMQREALLPTAELAAQSDLAYYTEDSNRQVRPSTDFTITDYEMTLRFGTELQAEVQMTVTVATAQDYAFTLSHHYRVSGVWDGAGTPLTFAQDGDTVTVLAKGNPVIRMAYRGAADQFLSNAQAIWLPGYFCWYPIEERYPVWKDYGYALNTDQSARRFSVQVKTVCPCFSNLVQSEGGIFSGSAATLTLVGGLYVQTERNGVREICPWCAEPVDVAAKLATAVERYNRTSQTQILVPTIKSVIYAPSYDLPVPFGGQNAVFLGDTLLLGGYQYGLDITGVLDCYLREETSCWN